MQTIDIFVEAGQKRTFAGAIEWPGWCRSGRDEASALEALINYAPRYLDAVSSSPLIFQPPAGISAFAVVERVEGDTSTDFGVPRNILSSDAWSVDDAELNRYQELLKSFWQLFDETARAAAGKELRKGPRGGGRELDEIVWHVVEADAAYLTSVGWKLTIAKEAGLTEKLRQTRQATLQALAASAHGQIPARGPRGGMRWTPRYFMRRISWHLLDHAWEIEDRIVTS